MKAIEDSLFNTSDIVHVLDVFFFSVIELSVCFVRSVKTKNAEKSL